MICNITDPCTHEICQIQILNLNFTKQSLGYTPSFPLYALTYQDNTDFPNKKRRNTLVNDILQTNKNIHFLQKKNQAKF